MFSFSAKKPKEGSEALKATRSTLYYGPLSAEASSVHARQSLSEMEKEIVREIRRLNPHRPLDPIKRYGNLGDLTQPLLG